MNINQNIERENIRVEMPEDLFAVSKRVFIDAELTLFTDWLTDEDQLTMLRSLKNISYGIVEERF